MKLEHEMLVNRYGQCLIEIDILLLIFENFEPSFKNIFLNDILFLILQSKPEVEDIETAIIESKLRSTYTPCVLLKNGVANHNLLKIAALPVSETKKVFRLLKSLFKIAYQRRYKIEKNNPDKWWYWDFSNELVVNRIRSIESQSSNLNPR